MSSAKQYFNLACEKIAECFILDGYRYFKSQKCIKKQIDDLTFTISFLRKDKGSYPIAEMYMSVIINSNKFEHWIKTQHKTFCKTGSFAGSQIGLLSGKNEFPTWSFGSTNNDDEWFYFTKEKETQEIESAVNYIKTHAFPYFLQFENIDILAKRLEKEIIPATSPASNVEFLLAHDKKDSAIKQINLILHERSEYKTRFEKFLCDYRENGFRDYFYGDEFDLLAYVVFIHKINV